MRATTRTYLAASLLTAVGIVSFAAAEAAPSSKGSIPSDAFSGNSIKIEKVPDFIVAYNRSGEVAGYVKKEDLFDKDGKHHERPIIVLDETLTRPKGRMVPGRGFVSLGVRDDDVPKFETIDEDEEAVDIDGSK